MAPKTEAAISEIHVPDHVSRASHVEYKFGGLPVHVFGIEEATESLKNAPSDELVIFNVVHPRTRTYEYSERMAHIFLHEYNKARSEGRDLPPAVASAFDLRNHGHRVISEGNLDWKKGNSHHGHDIVTVVLGSAQDTEFIMDVLPGYLPTELTTSSNGQLKKVWNIVTGSSQGGHVSWKVAAHADSSDPQKKNRNLLAAVPIIASPDITTMLVHRVLYQLCGFSRADAREFLETKILNDDKLPFNSAAYLSWPELVERLEAAGVKNAGSDILPRFWPQHIHNLISAEDRLTLDNAKKNVPNLFVVNSRDDPLVPSWLSYPFSKQFPLTGRPSTEAPADKTLYEEPGLGHITTVEMVYTVSDFLINVVANRKKDN